MVTRIRTFVAAIHVPILATLVVVACSPSSVGSPTAATAEATVAPTALPADAGWACPSPVTDAWGGSGLGDPYSPFWGNGGYDVQHYDIDLQVDPEANHVQGRTTIHAGATRDLDAFNLDFLGMEISNLLVNGTAAEFCRDDSGELTVLLPRPVSVGEAFTISVAYQGTPMVFDFPGEFSYGWVKAEEGVFTSGAPTDPAFLYPNNEHDSRLATRTIVVTVPEGYQVSTVGSLDGAIQKDGRVTTIWNQKEPSSSMVLSIDRDSVVSTLEGPDGLPIRFQYPASLEHWFEETIQDAPEYLEYFSSIYGPFPFDRFGITVVNREVIPVSTPTLVFITSVNHDIRLAHELTHQWFPYSAVSASWENAWLNDGIATYAEVLWQEHKGQSAEDLARVRYQELPAATHPPGLLTPEQMQSDEIWDVLYARPGLTFAALRLRVGDEAFFSILKTFAGRYQGRTGSAGDFIAVAEDISGQDLQSFFDQWLFQEPVPDIPELGLSKSEG